jgi:hypothetical protein
MYLPSGVIGLSRFLIQLPLMSSSMGFLAPLTNAREELDRVILYLLCFFVLAVDVLQSMVNISTNE